MRIFTKKTSCTWKEWNENMILTFSKDSKKFFIDKKFWSSHWGSDMHMVPICKTPRQCNFFSNAAEYFEAWALTPDWANVIVQLFVGKRAGADPKHNWWSLSKGCIEIWKDGVSFDVRLRNWESWLLMKDIQKGISKQSAVWLIIIMGNIQSQANKCAFSWRWQSQEII